MKRMGLCLVAVFALSAVLVSSAFATAPEYKICGKAAKSGKLYTGKYTDKACSKEATGAEITEGKHNKYERVEWSKAKKKTFKGKNSGTPHNLAVDPETTPGEVKGTTECTKEAVAGEVTGPKTSKWKTTYTHCIGDGTPCKTSGAKAGEIKTEELESTLVFLDAAKTKVALRVKGTGPGGLLAQYECEVGINVHVYGEVLAPQEGNTNSANKKTKVVVKGGPDNLQSNTYEEEKHNETYAKSYFEWVGAFSACVKEEVAKKVPQAEAEGICFVKVTGEKGEKPEAPVTLLSKLEGPAVEALIHEKEVTLPSTQNGTTEQTGEAFLIET